MVESKSLKLYLFSFRNHGGFHEDCVNIILKDLRTLMEPKFIEVQGKFLPRGGISIDPYSNWGRPDSAYAEMANYRLKHHDLFFENIHNR
jgi:7-cyano-7-deazaguanine reductase